MFTESYEKKFFYLKMFIIFICAFLMGTFLICWLFSATDEIVKEITEIISLCMKTDFDRAVCLLSVFLTYFSLLFVIWITCGNILAKYLSIFVVILLGFVYGFLLRAIFGMGFAYGSLVFFTNCFPGWVMLVAAFMCIAGKIQYDFQDIFQYTKVFFVPLILIILACFYLSYIGPCFFSLIIKAI